MAVTLRKLLELIKNWAKVGEIIKIRNPKRLGYHGQSISNHRLNKINNAVLMSIYPKRSFVK